MKAPGASLRLIIHVVSFFAFSRFPSEITQSYRLIDLKKKHPTLKFQHLAYSKGKGGSSKDAYHPLRFLPQRGHFLENDPTGQPQAGQAETLLASWNAFCFSVSLPDNFSLNSAIFSFRSSALNHINSFTYLS